MQSLLTVEDILWTERERNLGLHDKWSWVKGDHFAWTSDNYNCLPLEFSIWQSRRKDRDKYFQPIDGILLWKNIENIESWNQWVRTRLISDRSKGFRPFHGSMHDSQHDTTTVLFKTGDKHTASPLTIISLVPATDVSRLFFAAWAICCGRTTVQSLPHRAVPPLP